MALPCESGPPQVVGTRPDPVRGRISNPQRLNRYTYVMGDPVNRRDRLGLGVDPEPFVTESEYRGGTTYKVTFSNCKAAFEHLKSQPGIATGTGSIRHNENHSLNVKLPPSAASNTNPCTGTFDYDRFAPKRDLASFAGHMGDVL